MPKFTLAQALLAIAVVCLLCAYVSSSPYWFGPAKLRRLAVDGRILLPNNQMFARGDSARMPWEGKLNVGYKCPHCQIETMIPRPEDTEFSARDISRFKNHSSGRYYTHFDMYCSGCRRPLRITAKMGLLLRFSNDPDRRQEVFFHEVIESEY